MFFLQIFLRKEIVLFSSCYGVCGETLAGTLWESNFKNNHDINRLIALSSLRVTDHILHEKLCFTFAMPSMNIAETCYDDSTSSLPRKFW